MLLDILYVEVSLSFNPLLRPSPPPLHPDSIEQVYSRILETPRRFNFSRGFFFRGPWSSRSKNARYSIIVKIPHGTENIV
jgi:hypothetical protein